MATDTHEAPKEQGSKTGGNSPFDAYQTSLTTRYCSAAMSKLFSQRTRHSTWRRLWFHLAESERALGIDAITPEALEQMTAHLEVTDEDFEVARIEEKRRRHVGRPISRFHGRYSLLTSHVVGCHGGKPFTVREQPSASLFLPLADSRVARSRLWCCCPGRGRRVAPRRDKLLRH